MVRKGISGTQGNIKDSVRYLGPHIRVRDSSHQEVTRRCSAARTAFYRVGGIWSLAIPFKLRKLLLVGNVQNALLSGLEAFVLSKADYCRLDSCLASLARVAMLGRATHKGGNHARSLSHSQVLLYWRLLDSECEMRVRRLK
eukprot:9020909-Pyramimonas_sp.AAC.1